MPRVRFCALRQKRGTWRKGKGSMLEAQYFDTYIDSSKSHSGITLAELRRNKDLIYLLTKRDFVSKYKQSVLGPLWMLISPILGSLVFAFVFGTLAGLSTDGLPRILFYMTGNTLWSLFSHSVTTCANSFIQNRTLFSKVYFPRVTVCISSVLSSCINFAIQFVMLILFMIYYAFKGVHIAITPYMLLIPLLLAQCLLLGIGVGMILSATTIKYRDFIQMIGFGMSAWLYLTPVAYPLSISTGTIHTIMLINPMTSVIQNYRFALLGSGSFLLWPWIGSLILTAAVVVLGLRTFHRVERTVVDTL